MPQSAFLLLLVPEGSSDTTVPHIVPLVFGPGGSFADDFSIEMAVKSINAGCVL